MRIGDLLRYSYVPPTLRRPSSGVAELIAGQKCSALRPIRPASRAWRIAHWQQLAAHGQVLGQYDKSVLIFDPKTSALLAEQSYATYAKIRLTTRTAYPKAYVVNSLSSTTPMPTTPGPA